MATVAAVVAAPPWPPVIVVEPVAVVVEQLLSPVTVELVPVLESLLQHLRPIERIGRDEIHRQLFVRVGSHPPLLPLPPRSWCR
jgi:hypothetical protein